jgi:PAS domain S-box-containing protein
MMNDTQALAAAYRLVFERFVQAGCDLAREQALLEAGELSKVALADGPATDRMVALHQATQAALAEHWSQVEGEGAAALARLARGDATALLMALTLPHEIAQLGHHERRWQRAHDTLTAMFEQTGQLIVMLDADGLIEDVNPAFVEATGWSPMEAVLGGVDVWPALPEPVPRVWRVAQPRRVGGGFMAEWSVSPIVGRQGLLCGHVCIGRDVTRATQVEESLRENDKLRAVASLAGGIAHDFNNLLGSILGLAELCALEAPVGSRLARNLGRISQAGGNAAHLVRQLLDFSRQTPASLQVLQAGPWLHSVQALLQAAVLGRVGLQLQVLDDGPVCIDPVQMEQVLLNLVRNAADAMQGREAAVQLLLDRAQPRATVSGAGDWLRIRVSDTGCGIAADALAHIFEPFYTTKAVGEGTGLGLSAVHGIVSSHGGFVEADSVAGTGSTFSVFLPRVSL